MLLPKDIPGYEGEYGVTIDGKVYSYKRNKFMKPALGKQGYLYIHLQQGNKGKKYKIHRLVAMTYISNPNNYPCINHKDENKLNNHVSNLEWCTYKYNTNYGTCIQRRAKKMTGENNPMYGKTGKKHHLYGKTGEKAPMYGKHHTEEAKNKMSKNRRGKTGKKVQCIETGQIFNSTAEANEYLGKNRHSTNIQACCNGRNKIAYGFHWKYIEQ